MDIVESFIKKNIKTSDEFQKLLAQPLEKDSSELFWEAMEAEEKMQLNLQKITQDIDNISYDVRAHYMVEIKILGDTVEIWRAVNKKMIATLGEKQKDLSELNTKKGPPLDKTLLEEVLKVLEEIKIFSNEQFQGIQVKLPDAAIFDQLNELMRGRQADPSVSTPIDPSTTQAENESLKTQLKEYEMTIKKMKGETTGFKMMNDMAEQEHMKALDNINSIKREKKILEEENEKLQSQKIQLNNDIQSLSEIKNKLSGEQQSLERNNIYIAGLINKDLSAAVKASNSPYFSASDLSKIKSTFENYINKSKDKSLVGEIKKYQTETEYLQKNIDILEQEIKEANSKLKIFEENLEKVEEERKKNINLYMRNCRMKQMPRKKSTRPNRHPKSVIYQRSLNIIPVQLQKQYIRQCLHSNLQPLVNPQYLPCTLR
eukprot:TRINITY_DN31412_c0_g1_i2.p1 TRINITY_DN31412_c0_g1~~TRINITY_DN31412_c0_g1_i2.p1  ORF type:complete len:430 (+),score=95.15 TRINITY_DN31412_c0_g1_i2:419-1708(+)